VNDYSWVLLKDGKPAQADAAIEKVLQYFPNNPWLYNSDAIALSEMGDATTAKARITVAAQAVRSMTVTQWARAYPGNDPSVVGQGLEAFKAAVMTNLQRIGNDSAVLEP
jgi:Tfp pilus assembly protein PilF